MPVPQASTSRSGIAKSSKSGMLKSVPHVRSPASTTSPLPNVRRTDTRVHDSQISETRRPFDESIRNEQTHAISSQNGPSTPPRVPRRTKDRKIERESTEVSNTPTERNTTVTPPPPRPVRPLPRRCTQSPILQTINRRMREKNSDQEREFLDRSNLEQGEDAQTQHQLLGVSSRSGPSAPARPSISVRQQQPRPLAQSSRGLKSPSLSLPLTSPSATRLPFASTSDAFSLPAASRRAPPTSDISRLKTVQSQDQQAATEPVISQLDVIPSTNLESSSLPAQRRRKRKADYLDGEAPLPTRSSQRLINKMERDKETRRLAELAEKKAERAKRRKIKVMK